MNKTLLEISDGKLYGSNDMAKIGCHDCMGCSSCCTGMGDTIWLDPYDVFQLTGNLGKSMEELLGGVIEFHVEDGLILPNLRMLGEECRCGFLDDAGRCSIHAFRPGFCRLFPLGRNYEDGKLTYFILKDACPVPNKSKVKIHKWLNIPNLKSYEKFLQEWHELTKKLRGIFEERTEEDALLKAVNMKFLQVFYLTPYTKADFYMDIQERMTELKTFLESLGMSV